MLLAGLFDGQEQAGLGTEGPCPELLPNLGHGSGVAQTLSGHPDFNLRITAVPTRELLVQ